MPAQRFNVRKVAVLGAGVMGAQIAAHLVNVRVPVILFDLPAKEGPKNGIVTKAVENLKKLKPAPLGIAEDAALHRAGELRGAPRPPARMRPRHRGDRRAHGLEARPLHEGRAERSRRTRSSRATPRAFRSPSSREVLPEQIRPRFCGIHFFNPPRYMALVELIATPTTDPKILDDLEAFVTTSLGKGVVRAKDTPNFIANRVGIAGMLATMKEAETYGLTYDVVDDLTGKKLGRASSGTFRTADVVGLDTMAHVIKTLQDNLGPEQGNDPFFASFATPAVLQDADRRGRARPEDRRRLLQEGRQGHPALRRREGRLRARRRQGRRGRRAHAEEAAGRAAEAAARLEEPAGAVPVGDPARQLPLRRGAPRRHRRERARRRLRDALGIRHAARARSSSGSRPAGRRSRSG